VLTGHSRLPPPDRRVTCFRNNRVARLTSHAASLPLLEQPRGNYNNTFLNKCQSLLMTFTYLVYLYPSAQESTDAPSKLLPVNWARFEAR